MEKVNTKFSLRETLQYIIPGIYFIGLTTPILQEFNLVLYLSDPKLNIIFAVLFALIIGMLIYAIDIPKRLFFFKDNLPIVLIKKNYTLDVKINDYFDFYDKEISDKQKANIEKYTSIYHFSVNIFLVSFFFSIVYLIVYKCDFLNSYGFPILIMTVLSFCLTFLIFYGKNKIKDNFQRQAEKYHTISNNKTSSRKK